MIFWVAAALAAATPLPQTPLAEADHAIKAGRLDQARTMIAAAVSTGASGPAVDRLLADLAYAAGDNARALAGYSTLLVGTPDDSTMAERAGIAALRLNRTEEAAALLTRAASLPAASWRAWNALGVAADRRSDWETADTAYARAAALAPDRAEISNNVGWSLLLRGEWEAAAAELERAASLDPRSSRIADNLEFARAAVDAGLPARRAGESDEGWAARLNDAGVAAAARGDRARAVAAFAQAIEARSAWYQRAANNLALVEGQK